MIRNAITDDFDAWLDLAREVEPLFGEMAGNARFKSAIMDCIIKSSAFCIVNENEVEGIIAIDKAANEISWLAVRKRCRGKGYGYQLLMAALSNLDRKRPVYVQTFSSGIKAGEAARKMYIKSGFRDLKDGGKNPAGIDTVIMKLGSSTD